MVLTQQHPDTTSPSSELGLARRPGGCPEHSKKTSLCLRRQTGLHFRTLPGLCRRAGATQDNLFEVIVKEIVDNSLDAGRLVRLSIADGLVVIQDDGPWDRRR